MGFAYLGFATVNLISLCFSGTHCSKFVCILTLSGNFVLLALIKMGDSVNEWV